jgi:uncharacterized protein YbjT (DUF2867 family)
MKKVLLIGGTGRSGIRTALQLVQQGHALTALVRDPDKARALLPPGTQLVRGDVSDVGSLRQPLANVDSVVIILPLTEGKRSGFIAERDGTANIVAALPKQRKIEIVKLSEIGVGTDPDFFDLACKAKAEELIRESGHPYVFLRPTWFMEAWPLLLMSMGKYLVVGSNRRGIHWIGLDDVAQWLATSVTRFDAVAGQALIAQGKDALTFAKAGQKVSAATGRGLTRLPVGALAPAGWFSPRWRTVHELFRFYDRGPELFEAEPTWRLLGEPQVTFDAFVRTLPHKKDKM